MVFNPFEYLFYYVCLKNEQVADILITFKRSLLPPPPPLPMQVFKMYLNTLIGFTCRLATFFSLPPLCALLLPDVWKKIPQLNVDIPLNFYTFSFIPGNFQQLNLVDLEITVIFRAFDTSLLF